jgi:hypothetical protein
MMEAAFAEVSRALAAGELVGLFPEGRITFDGEISPFRPGITRILEANPVPVIPMALRGMWGSMFSRKDGPALSRPLRRGLFSRIELVAGPACRRNASACPACSSRWPSCGATGNKPCSARAEGPSEALARSRRAASRGRTVSSANPMAASVSPANMPMKPM